MNIINTIHQVICGPILISSLLGIGIFFTVYLKFPQIRFIPHSIRLLLGIDKSKQINSNNPSAFQSLATSLGGSIGVGCIAGTGMAISIGGPSSILWMVITSIIGMATKYGEVVICHRYRTVEGDTYSGTPMNFLKNKLNLSFLAIIMAIGIIVSSFTSGNMPQANSIAIALYQSLGIKQIYTGIVLAIVIGVIILGGVKTISAVAEKLIPIMSLIFLIISLFVIIYNYKNIIPSLKLMFFKPFTASATVGGFLGSTMNMAVLKGVNKGLFTSDAGSGVSGIAHAASNETNSHIEGVYSIIEPFLSTAIMCSLTGLVIIVSGVWNHKFYNRFDYTDIIILDGVYDDKSHLDAQKLRKEINNIETLPKYNDELNIVNGKIANEVTVLNMRSVAEDVIISQNESPFSGKLNVINGKVVQKKNTTFYGKSLLASVLSSIQAFQISPLRKLGSILLNICLLLFGLTTIIAWYYYGDRAIVFLGGGPKLIMIYKIIYLLLFVYGALVDTSIIWKLSELFYAFMTIPNLIGMFLMRKVIKKLTNTLG